MEAPHRKRDAADLGDSHGAPQEGGGVGSARRDREVTADRHAVTGT